MRDNGTRVPSTSGDKLPAQQTIERSPGEGHETSPVVRDSGAECDGASAGHPTPRANHGDGAFVWDEDAPAADNYDALGARLALGGLYRKPGYGGGLLLIPDQTNAEPVAIDTPRKLAAVIADRLIVVKAGNGKAERIPAADLATMPYSEAFLQHFPPLDDVARVAHYLPDFELIKPGYNDGGPGLRLFHAGPGARVEGQPTAVNAFLDVMAFAGQADRTNAVGAALTVMLRYCWPGARPLLAVTSSKSHGGKDTVIAFAAGSTPKVSVSYEGTDWALEKTIVALLKAAPDTGVLNVENARLGRGDRYIGSAFLERLLTDPEPTHFSPGTGGPRRARNNLVLALSANLGTISEDLMNRALPVRLDPVGDVADRKSPIGNPKLEYLPAHRERIEAELRGMVERWKAAGRPLDDDVRHPFGDWARTVGGILRVNGFEHFLANYSLRKTADDPLRHALGLLGTARPGEWLRADDWARLAVGVGVVKAVIPQHDRDSERGRERGIGVVLSAHRDETFEVETEGERLTLRLEKRRARFDGGEPTVRYRFQVVGKSALPEDGPVG
jgi:hypothetical protein